MPGSQELLIIALVALFVLGPERLPGLARSAARGLTKVRNYGVTASKELRGVADLGEIEREVSDLRRELARTRADLRRAMRDTVASSPSSSPSVRSQMPAGEDPVEEAVMERTPETGDTPETGGAPETGDTPETGDAAERSADAANDAEPGGDAPSSRGA